MPWLHFNFTLVDEFLLSRGIGYIICWSFDDLLGFFRMPASLVFRLVILFRKEVLFIHNSAFLAYKKLSAHFSYNADKKYNITASGESKKI